MKPKPDSAQWWQEVAAGLGVEIAKLKDALEAQEREIAELRLERDELGSSRFDAEVLAETRRRELKAAESQLATLKAEHERLKAVVQSYERLAADVVAVSDENERLQAELGRIRDCGTT